jgi:hypothetical protein
MIRQLEDKLETMIRQRVGDTKGAYYLDRGAIRLLDGNKARVCLILEGDCTIQNLETLNKLRNMFSSKEENVLVGGGSSSGTDFLAIDIICQNYNGLEGPNAALNLLGQLMYEKGKSK